MIKNTVTAAFVIITCIQFVAAHGQNKLFVMSPDKNIRFSVMLQSGHLAYTVWYKNKKLISESTIGLSFVNNDHFGDNIYFGKIIIVTGTEAYDLVAGKTSHVNDKYNEAVILMMERNGSKRVVNFVVRLFNDGLGFRYDLPVQKSWTSYKLTEENSCFNIVGNPMARVAFMENFTTSHEHRYNVLPLDSITNDRLIDMPALFEFPGKIYMAITEANLLNYAGMSLVKRDGMLCSQLSPLPGQQEVKVVAMLPHNSPWRVLMISDRVGALIESNILTNLSEPCSITDLSWLKPGKTSFHWWNGDIMPDTTFEPGANFNFNKYYIDFCSRNNIEFHSVIGYRGVAWYQNDGNEYQPGPHTDILTPRPGLDIQKICDYAKSKGVGIRFWVHWKALYAKLDSAFTQFEKWGIKGMMVDFMDRDDQQMVNIQEEILQKAALHHLEIQFHGSFKPTGLSRTYPNESTREGTLNYENNKWGNLITPDDDIEIPFTRLLAGSTDYHLGGFRAMPATGFKNVFTRPHMLGTRCHMLAMYVILENHLSMVCDYPEAYEGQDGFEFIRQVPTVWDQTVVPGAEPGQWVCIARRKGAYWYIGAITNSTSRNIVLPLNFLATGSYHAEIYKDTPGVAINPNGLIKEIKDINSSEKLEFNVPAGGGVAIRLTAK